MKSRFERKEGKTVEKQPVLEVETSVLHYTLAVDN